MPFSTDEMLKSERDKITAFAKEVQQQFEGMHADIRRNFATLLDDILGNQVIQFGKAIEQVLKTLAIDATNKALSESAASLNQSFSRSGLQAGAELLKNLERAKRNL